MEAAKKTCIGFDVGKSMHRACAISHKTGEVLFNRALKNRADVIDEVLKHAGTDALVIVDQKHNIGSLVLERARAVNMEVAYLPSLAMKRARDMFPGIAKTDEIDAEVIARTALGMPWTLRPISEDGATGSEIRLLGSQRRFLTRSIVQCKNRLRAVLLEIDPAFEAAINLGADWQIDIFKAFGGPAGIVSAGRRRYNTLAAKKSHVPTKTLEALWQAALTSSRSERQHTKAEDRLVRMLAERIEEDARRSVVVNTDINILLTENDTYQALLTIPGIGPKTASALVAGIDISLFSSHDKLASFVGLAPNNKQSGTSLNSATSSRCGNKELKNLLIFSCNSLIGTKSRFGHYYEECRARNMRHNKALKAVARKRLKIIYAVMRDARPYVEA